MSHFPKNADSLVSPQKVKSPKILVLLSGSIASYKACTLISKLVQSGCEVQTYATPAALNFVGKASLEGLSSRPVLEGLFQEQHMMDHINLIHWADLLIVYPASANTFNKLAAGIAEEPIGALFLANNFQKPFWLAPAMNTQMWQHPATQNSLQILQKWGARILFPTAGNLACGAVGAGRVEEPEIVAQEIMRFLKTEAQNIEVKAQNEIA